MSVQMSVQSKRFVFPTPKMSIQVSIQMSVLSVFPIVQTVQISCSFFQMYYLKKNITQRTQKKPQKRLYRRSKTVLNLSGSLYQVRLDNHRTFRVFYGSIGQTGMQQTTLSDTDLALSQSIKYGRNTAEIEVSFLINQVYMDNFTHSILHLFHCKYTKYILYGII